MIHRNKRTDDIHYGKYNGIGGKLESTEDVIEGLKREVFEEAGITCEEIVLRGTISWPGFGKNGEHWFAFIFRIDKFSGELKDGNHEGSLEWVSIDDMEKLDLWESDRLWLDKVFARDANTFHGIAPFENGKLVSWGCSVI
jgi:8-oxo-dGTP diphosphatase